MHIEVAELTRGLERLAIDFEKSTPFAEWVFLEVTFDAANKDTTIRHGFTSNRDIIVVPVEWRFAAAPATAPVIYRILGAPLREGYLKVRSTVAGEATVLVAVRRDQ